VSNQTCRCTIVEIADDLVVTLEHDDGAGFRDIADQLGIHYVALPCTLIETFRVHTDATRLYDLLVKLVIGDGVVVQYPSEQMFKSLWDACNCVMSDAVSYLKVRELLAV
jgi:hypothetical protein